VSAAELEHKAASTTPDVGLLGSDDATGVVEAIVSVTGVVDHDYDIIEPGAYTKSLTRRRPKGIFHHDWHKWASKTVAIEEWMPGDPRLPVKTKDGQPWPAEAGALYVKTQYNLKTTQGRDAYENVKFYGPECEWSVGYRVPPGKSSKDKAGVRHIKEMDLFEYSPVLFGANSMSGTLAVKSLDGDPQEPLTVDAQELEELQAEADAVPDDELEEPPADQDDQSEDEDQPEDQSEDEHEPEGDAPPVGSDPAESKRVGTGLDRSPKKNWVELAGGLPAYIEEIAKSIHEKRGMPISSAIPIAIATVKKWARGGGDVTPATQAKAAKALAAWEKLKAASGRKDVKTAEQPSPAETVESTIFPHLPGTYEELREQIRSEAAKAFDGGHIEVMGTWPGHAVITWYDADGATKSFELPYTVTVDGEGRAETITLDEPEPVELLVSVDGGSEEEGKALLPFPSQIEDATVGLKAWLAHTDHKAGRVLSAVNERRLLGAVESLVAVLKAAGLDIDTKPRQGDEKDEQTPSDVAPVVDSTAPSAQPDARSTKEALDPALLARGIQIAAAASQRRIGGPL
jgi:phage head maturation protease